MSPNCPSRYPRRDLLRWSAALPAVTLAARLVPALAAPAMPALAQDATIAELVAGNTAFALDMYAELARSTNSNLLISPYSISQALAMTYAGARGETAAQMADVLAFTASPTDLGDMLGGLNTDLVERGNAEAAPDAGNNARALRLANALWGERTYPFSAAFTAEMERVYGAGLQQTDFKGAPEAAREEINTWVADQTEDRIQDIVPEDAIDTLTRLVLANAIYFSAQWLAQFDPDDTEDDDFHLLDGTTVSVPFMFQRDHFAYARGDGFQAIELDYAGDMGSSSGFAFTVILPDVGQFEAVEAGLTADSLNAALGVLAWEDVRLWLPRFRFEFGPASLVQTLIALGMTDAFDADLADFTGMVDGTPPEPLFVSEVLHKAFIGVDEEGTEAAAATIVIMAAGAAPGMPTPPPPIEVRIDRPFLFAIRDTVTGTVLFIGRVLEPTSA